MEGKEMVKYEQKGYDRAIRNLTYTLSQLENQMPYVKGKLQTIKFIKKIFDIEE